MKKLTLAMVVLAAALSGCVAYDQHPGAHSRPHHDGAQRDRDRDGVPNRMDRDRDGDGVRNRDDARPNNPGRY